MQKEGPQLAPWGCSYPNSCEHCSVECPKHLAKGDGPITWAGDSVGFEEAGLRDKMLVMWGQGAESISSLAGQVGVGRAGKSKARSFALEGRETCVLDVQRGQPWGERSGPTWSPKTSKRF